jgi:hypothetical protein
MTAPDTNGQELTFGNTDTEQMERLLEGSFPDDPKPTTDQDVGGQRRTHGSITAMTGQEVREVRL